MNTVVLIVSFSSMVLSLQQAHQAATPKYITCAALATTNTKRRYYGRGHAYLLHTSSSLAVRTVAHCSITFVFSNNCPIVD